MSAQGIPQTTNWKTLNGLSNIIRSFSINEDLLPAVTLIYSLGSEAFKWLNLYVQNIYATNADIGTIDCTTLAVSGNITGGGTLTIGGASTLNSLTVTTTTTLTGNTVCSANLGVTGTLTCGTLSVSSMSCTTLNCTGAATIGGALTSGALTCSSISCSGSSSVAAFSCSSLTCSGALTTSSFSTTSLSITGSGSFGASTPITTSSGGVLTVQNTTDISLVSVVGSIISSGGVYVAKSIRCVATVNAASYSGTAGITTSSNAVGFSQGTGTPATSSINFLSSSTEIGGLLTLTSGLTVTAGTTTVQNLTVSGTFTFGSSLTLSGLLTCNAGLTVSGSTATLSTTNIGGLLTCTSGLTVSGSTTTLSTTNIGGLLTCSAALTISSGTLTTKAITASTTGSNPYTLGVTDTSDNRLTIQCINAGTAGTPGISLKRGTSTSDERNVIYIDTSNNFAIYSNALGNNSFGITNSTGAISCPYAVTLCSTSGAFAVGSTTALQVTAAGLVNVQNASDVSGATGSIQTAGGIYCAKSLSVAATTDGGLGSGSVVISGGVSIAKNLFLNSGLYAIFLRGISISVSDTAAHTWVQGDIANFRLGTVLVRTGQSTTRNDTFLTAAALVAATSAVTGSTFDFVLHNSGSFDVSISTGSGATFVYNQAFTTNNLVAGYSRRCFIRVTNGGAGTEAYTMFW